MAALRAGEASGEADVLAVLFLVHGADSRQSVGEAQGRFKRLRQAQVEVIAHLEAVNDDFNTVFLVLFQFRHIVQVGDDAVDAGTYKTGSAQLLEYMQVLAFTLTYHRCQQHQLTALGQCQHGVHHLADCLRLQVFAVLRTARLTYPGIEQTQVIIDFGDGAHGGARVVGGRFLFYGDGRGQALDMVHIGLFHHRQELPCIGRQGLDIAPLALGIQRVKGQR